MLKLILLTFKNFGSSVSRNLYWYLRLSQVKFGSGFRYKWPVRLEGKGKMSVGKNAIINRNVYIGIGKGSAVNVGNNCYIDQDVTIKLKEPNTLQAGGNLHIGAYSRIFIQNNWEWGNDVTISTYCQIFSRERDLYGKLNIGHGSSIGDGTLIDVADDVLIGNEVAIGPNCVLYTHDHLYENKSLPAWKGKIHTGKIIIEDGVWIGTGVIILPDIRIGCRAVIAAGSVVTKDVPAETVWAGVPAKQIK